MEQTTEMPVSWFHYTYVDGYFTLSTIAICVALTVLFKHLITSLSLKNYPPGPRGLPIVGYLPYLTDNFHKDLVELQKKYGKIISLNLGSQRTVVLNDFKAIKESNQKDDFVGRPPGFFYLSDTVNHLNSMNGDPWKESRRFTFSALRTLGMGKNRVEEFVQGQISLLLQRLEEHDGADVEIGHYIQPAINNTIFFLTCGRTASEDMQKLNSMVDNFGVVLLKYYSIYDMAQYFPVLRPLITLFSSEARKCRKEMDEIEQVLWKEIESRKKSYDDSILDDYMDIFLNEMMKRKDKTSTFTDRVLNGNSQLLLIAGSDTIKSTIEWTILAMAKFPQVQEKVYRQIVDVLGENRPPSWEDRRSLPYLEAFIMEVSRWKTLAPLADPHWTLNDTTVQSYFIPKGTVVLNNLYAVHNDPDLFPEPESFRPERFLSADGKEARASEYLIPFGIGKRMCPGEKLASMQVFTFVAAVLQRFKILPPSGGLNMNERTFIVVLPVSTNVRIERRTI